MPEERWTGIKPKVDYFRVFGSVAHVHVPIQKRIKLDDRSHRCVMLGVSEESKAYRLYNPITKKITISRDVIFEEEAQWDWTLSTPEQNIFTWEDDDGVLEEEKTEDEYEEEGPENSIAIHAPREETEEITTATNPVREHEKQ